MIPKHSIPFRTIQMLGNENELKKIGLHLQPRKVLACVKKSEIQLNVFNYGIKFEIKIPNAADVNVEKKRIEII